MRGEGGDMQRRQAEKQMLRLSPTALVHLMHGGSQHAQEAAAQVLGRKWAGRIKGPRQRSESSDGGALVYAAQPVMHALVHVIRHGSWEGKAQAAVAMQRCIIPGALPDPEVREESLAAGALGALSGMMAEGRRLRDAAELIQRQLQECRDSQETLRQTCEESATTLQQSIAKLVLAERVQRDMHGSLLQMQRVQAELRAKGIERASVTFEVQQEQTKVTAVDTQVTLLSQDRQDAEDTIHAAEQQLRVLMLKEEELEVAGQRAYQEVQDATDLGDRRSEAAEKAMLCMGVPGLLHIFQHGSATNQAGAARQLASDMHEVQDQFVAAGGLTQLVHTMQLSCNSQVQANAASALAKLSGGARSDLHDKAVGAGVVNALCNVLQHSQDDSVLQCAAEAIYGFAEGFSDEILAAGGMAGLGHALKDGLLETQGHVVRTLDVLVCPSKRAMREAKRAGVVPGLKSVIRDKAINPPDWTRAVRVMQAINQYYGIAHKIPGTRDLVSGLHPS